MMKVVTGESIELELREEVPLKELGDAELERRIERSRELIPETR